MLCESVVCKCVLCVVCVVCCVLCVVCCVLCVVCVVCCVCFIYTYNNNNNNSVFKSGIANLRLGKQLRCPMGISRICTRRWRVCLRTGRAELM